MRSLPSRPPSWSRLTRTVRLSSTFNGLRIAPLRPGKPIQRYEQAHQACEQAMARYDHLDLLLHLLRETLHLCSPFGRLRTVEGVRAELTLLLSMIQEIDDAVLPHILQPIQAHIDDIVVPFQQVESLHAQLLDTLTQQTLDALVLA